MKHAVSMCLVLALFVTACGGEEPIGQANDPPAEEQADQGSAGQLVIGAAEDDYNVEPPEEANVGAMFGPNASIIETLVVPTPELDFEPLLATSWEFREPDTWRFELREDVTFHDGSAFDAEAVVATLNERLAGEITGLNADSARVVDDHTVDVVLDPPNNRILRFLSHPARGIVAPRTHPGAGTSAENTPTGTGPYEFASYRRDTELVVERNEEYWGEPPAFETMAFRFMPDGNSRALALISGDVDAIYDVPRSQVQELEDERDLNIIHSETGAHQSLFLNVHGDPPYDILGDKQVREALALAIDSDAIVQNVWAGGAEVGHTIVPPQLLGPSADMIEGHSYDPARAQELLEEAGWTPGPDGVRVKDGRPLELLMQVYQAEEQRPLPELVQAQASEVGIDISINVPADASAFFAASEAGEGDIFSEGSAAGVEHPYGPGGYIISEVEGYGTWVNPGQRYDELYYEGLKTADEEEFERIVAQMMDILVDEEKVVIPIAGVFRTYGLREGLCGFEPYTFLYSQRWHQVQPC